MEEGMEKLHWKIMSKMGELGKTTGDGSCCRMMPIITGVYLNNIGAQSVLVGAITSKFLRSASLLWCLPGGALHDRYRAVH